MDEESFKKTCVKEKEKRGGIHQPLYGTWVADFMLGQDTGKFAPGKYLSNKKCSWKRRRRLGMAVAGITPTASVLTKIGKMQISLFLASTVSALHRNAHIWNAHHP